VAVGFEFAKFIKFTKFAWILGFALAKSFNWRSRVRAENSGSIAGFSIAYGPVPRWRNGRRSGLKIHRG
jgi:hypothetical protein